MHLASSLVTTSIVGVKRLPWSRFGKSSHWSTSTKSRPRSPEPASSQSIECWSDWSSISWLVNYFLFFESAGLGKGAFSVLSFHDWYHLYCDLMTACIGVWKKSYRMPILFSCPFCIIPWTVHNDRQQWVFPPQDVTGMTNPIDFDKLASIPATQAHHVQLRSISFLSASLKRS